jgi:hypothetical protein
MYELTEDPRTQAYSTGNQRLLRPILKGVLHPLMISRRHSVDLRRTLVYHMQHPAAPTHRHRKRSRPNPTTLKPTLGGSEYVLRGLPITTTKAKVRTGREGESKNTDRSPSS